MRNFGSEKQNTCHLRSMNKSYFCSLTYEDDLTSLWLKPCASICKLQPVLFKPLTYTYMQLMHRATLLFALLKQFFIWSCLDSIPKLHFSKTVILGQLKEIQRGWYFIRDFKYFFLLQIYYTDTMLFHFTCCLLNAFPPRGETFKWDCIVGIILLISIQMWDSGYVNTTQP